MARGTAALRLGLAVATVLAAPASARAFDREVHDAITRAALAQIQVCVELFPQRWPALKEVATSSEPLVGCDRKQDDLFKKVALWHFYSPDLDIEGSFWQVKWLNGESSMEGFYRRLTERLLVAPDRAAIDATVGALLHYVQDAAVPAHVVPVFHPTLAGQQLHVGDKVDGFPFTSPKPVTTEAECARLLDAPPPAAALPVILRDTAAATLAALEQPIPPAALEVNGESPKKAVPRTWELFWSKRAPHADFGQYGCGADVFGSPSFVCAQSLFHAARVKVQPSAYQDFATARHRAAIEASVRVIASASSVTPASAAAASASRTTPGSGAAEPIVCPVASKGKGHHVMLCFERLDKKAARDCPPERAPTLKPALTAGTSAAVLAPR